MDFGTESIENITKAERIYWHLRKSIVTGKLMPKTKLVAKKIAMKMQVSEIPVREALQKLEGDGLVEIIPFTGTIVTEPSFSDLLDNLELRILLQPYAALVSAPLLDKNDIAQLELIYKDMDTHLSNEDVESYTQKNREFHWIVYHKSPNKKLLEIIQDLLLRTERARVIFKFHTSNMYISNQEHGAILSAIKKGDYQKMVEVESKQQKRVMKEIKELFSPAIKRERLKQ